MKSSLTLFSVCALAWSFAYAQVSVKPNVVPKPTGEHLSTVEKQWCPVIQSSFAESADLQAAMRSFVLNAISPGLKQCDSAAVRGALVTAFTATLAMPETQEMLASEKEEGKPRYELIATLTNLQTKEALQTDALRNLLPIDEAKAESLLPQAEPNVRGTVLNLMVSQAINAGKLDGALRLLNEMPAGAIFPYGSATQLMLDLPPTRDADRQTLFRRAMDADRQQHVTVIGGDDFGSMTVRFWKHLPPAVALQAIHQVLDESRSSKESVSLGSGPSRVAFTTEYDFRLFELLPVLRQLDKEEADKLLDDSQEAKTQLQNLPDGLQSLYPSVRDTPLKKGESGAMTGMVGQGLGRVLPQVVGAEAYDARISEIVRLAEDNPRQAIAEATALPNSAGLIAPRAKALLGIAQVAMVKNPSVARDALDEMSESLKTVEPSGHGAQRDYYGDGIDMAVKIGEIELARRLLRSGIDEADKLENKDKDSDNPNLALKAWWPSAAVLSRLVLAASHISVQTALDVATQITDPELRVLCRVRLANRYLGIPVQGMVMVATRSTQWAEFGGKQE